MLTFNLFLRQRPQGCHSNERFSPWSLLPPEWSWRAITPQYTLPLGSNHVLPFCHLPWRSEPWVTFAKGPSVLLSFGWMQQLEYKLGLRGDRLPHWPFDDLENQRPGMSSNISFRLCFSYRTSLKDWLCCIVFPGGRGVRDTGLFTSDREPVLEQKKILPKLNLVREPVRLLGSLTGLWVRLWGLKDRKAQPLMSDGAQGSCIFRAPRKACLTGKRCSFHQQQVFK